MVSAHVELMIWSLSFSVLYEQNLAATGSYTQLCLGLPKVGAMVSAHVELMIRSLPLSVLYSVSYHQLICPQHRLHSFVLPAKIELFCSDLMSSAESY